MRRSWLGSIIGLLAVAFVVFFFAVSDRSKPSHRSGAAAEADSGSASPSPTPLISPASERATLPSSDPEPTSITLDPAVMDTFQPRDLVDVPLGALSSNSAWQK